MNTIVEVLEVGGITLPLASAYAITQTYRPIGGSYIHRLMTGGAVKHMHWEKLSTTITGLGAIPMGLQGLQYGLPMVMKCISVRGINSPVPSIELPVERRTDLGYTPAGLALIGHTWVSSPVSIANSVCTITPVPDAVLYRVCYYPELIVFAQEPEESIDPYTKEFRWTLNAEQV